MDLTIATRYRNNDDNEDNNVELDTKMEIPIIISDDEMEPEAMDTREENSIPVLPLHENHIWDANLHMNKPAIEDVITISDDENESHMNAIVKQEPSPMNYCKADIFETNQSFYIKDEKINVKWEITPNLTSETTDKYQHFNFPFQCELCSSAFPEKDALRHHMRWHNSKKKLFLCVLCPETFRKHDNLNRHVKLHHSEKQHQCIFCSKKFALDTNLQKHIESNHKNPADNELLTPMIPDTDTSPLYNGTPPADISIKLHFCGLCTRSFKKAINLEAHMKIHYGEKSFECEPCGRKFVLKNNLFIHLRKIHNGHPVYRCNQCKKHFDKRNQFYTHLMQHSMRVLPIPKSKPKSKECKHCHAKFDTGQALKAHKKEHFPLKLSQCKICDATFPLRKELQEHMVTHSTKATKSDHFTRRSYRFSETGKPEMLEFKCELCQKSFIRSYWLAKHLNFHKDNPFDCKLCEKSFATQEILDEHMQSHYNVVVQKLIFYECFVCHRSVKTRSALIGHMKSHPAIQCEICFKPFPKFNRLVAHMKSHSNFGNPFPCNVCDQSYETSDGLRRHMHDHRDEKSHRCQYCPESFGLIIALRRHMQTHSVDAPVECDLCGKLYVSDTDLQAHVIKFHFQKFSIDKQNECPVCGRIYSQKAQLRNHILLHLDKERHQCYLCHRNFSSSSTLRLHLEKKNYDCTLNGSKVKTVMDQSLRSQLIHLPRGRKFECYICDASASHFYQMKEHMRVHTGERPFACTTCPLKFITNVQLKNHLKRGHSAPAKRTGGRRRIFKTFRSQLRHLPPGRIFGCYICGRTKFPHFCQLKLHMRFHTGERPFACTICPLKFISNTYLKKHLSRGHPAKAPRTRKGKPILTFKTFRSQLMHLPSGRVFECYFCGGQQKWFSKLKEHMRLHTGEMPFACTLCPKKFMRNTYLKQHFVRHSNPNGAFPCHLCQKTLTSAFSLRCHLRIHSGELPYSCSICSKSFRTTITLKTHMEGHNSNAPTSCEYCQRVFSLPIYLRKHIRQFHTGPNAQSLGPERVPQKNRIFECHLCGTVKKYFHELKYHFMRSHTGERPYKCGACSHRFLKKIYLKAHMRRHMAIEPGDTPFACLLCPKRFAAIDKINTHIRWTHTNDRYQCHVCDDIIYSLSALRAHIRAHGDEMMC